MRLPERPFPIGFALHCRRNKSPARPGTTSARTNVDGAAAGGRENRDFRLPAVLFRCGRQTGALSACTREIRRDPDDFRWSVDGRAEGSIRIRHCGILNSFFAPTALLLASRLRAAVVVRKSIQVCKDRALKRRYSVARARTYEFENRSGCSRTATVSACFIVAVDGSKREMRGNSKLRSGYAKEHPECFNINIKCSLQDDTQAMCAYKINLIFQRKIAAL